ncbi:hypothetical protein CRYO30217_02489 [Parvicella tangerina]|uniref:Uncharacterized protein n=1 Tax=Parvicella tangerina TaxID=2829795 RepID=A0A916JNE5_9FLAO|nr:hypothetical protein CRYO30217_02489 [Parvicella tangerina]
MLAPEESLNNSVKSSNEKDEHFENYLKTVLFAKYFFLTVLIFNIFQLLAFVSLFDGLYSSFIYGGTTFQLLQWSFDETTIMLFFKAVQVISIIVLFKLHRRVKTILEKNLHKDKGLNILVVILLFLQVLNPNYLNLAIATCSATIWLRLLYLHKKS